MSHDLLLRHIREVTEMMRQLAMVASAAPTASRLRELADKLDAVGREFERRRPGN